MSPSTVASTIGPFPSPAALLCPITRRTSSNAAPEAAAASIGWAFDQLGWGEAIHTIDPDNANSKTVAAKLGSTYQRMDRLPEPHHEKPVEVWGQTRAQWQARRAAHP